ncbi:MAG: hypothetical protein ACYS5V_10395 [Planctomycetota bacterium]|jgi:hypothetical protein
MTEQERYEDLAEEFLESRDLLKPSMAVSGAECFRRIIAGYMRAMGEMAEALKSFQADMQAVAENVRKTRRLRDGMR